MAPPGLHSAQYAPAEYESPPPPVPQQFQNSGRYIGIGRAYQAPLTPPNRRPPGGYTSVSIVSPQANSMSAGPPPVPVRSAREQYQNDLAEQIRLKKEREMQEKARLAEEDLKVLQTGTVRLIT